MRVYQSGVALVFALIFLTIMTVLGLFVVQNNILQERMSGNFRDMNLSFEAAEAALREGEKRALKNNITIIDELVKPDDQSYVDFLIKYFDDNTPYEYNFMSLSSDSLNLAANPKFIVERVNVQAGGSKNESSESEVKDVSFTGQEQYINQVYRVTAIAVGGTDSAVTILQSNIWP